MATCKKTVHCVQRHPMVHGLLMLAGQSSGKWHVLLLGKPWRFVPRHLSCHAVQRVQRLLNISRPWAIPLTMEESRVRGSLLPAGGWFALTCTCAHILAHWHKATSTCICKKLSKNSSSSTSSASHSLQLRHSSMWTKATWKRSGPKASKHPSP